MKSKLFLAVLLLTPLLVVLSATLFFQAGFSPKYTKNNAVLFNEYCDVSKLGLISDSKDLKFDDGKWIFAIYAIRNQDLEKALYLMRQLNIALNRDINKLKRVVFSFEESHISDQLIDYPRTEIIIDPDDKLFFELLREDHKYFDQQKIFLIDPYGRAVMYFPVSMDPKLILKDLKVLI